MNEENINSLNQNGNDGTVTTPVTSAPTAAPSVQVAATEPVSVTPQPLPVTESAPSPTVQPQPAEVTPPAPTPVQNVVAPSTPVTEPVTVAPTDAVTTAQTEPITVPQTEAIQDIKPGDAINPLPIEVSTTPSIETTPVTETVTTPVNNLQVGEVGFVNASADLKKKKKGPVIVILLVIFAILGVLGYFVIYPYVVTKFLSDPKNVYDVTIKSTFNALTTTSEEIAHTKAIYELEASLDTNIESLSDFSGYTYTANIGVDPTNEKLQFGLLIKDSNNQEHSYFRYIKDKKEYVRYSSYRDLIYVGGANLEDMSDIQTSFQDILDYSNNLNSDDLTYLYQKMAELLSESIDETKLTLEEASITINKETLKVTNNKYTINNDTYNKMRKYIIDGIINDEKALEILAKYDGKEKDELKAELEGIDTTTKELDEGQEIYVNIYTYSTKNIVVGYEINDNQSDNYGHYFFKDGYSEIKYYETSKDEETGKDVENKLLITSKTENSKNYININYNDYDIASLTVNEWSDNTKDFDYVINIDDNEQYNGNIKLVKDYSSEKLSYNLDTSVNTGDEYIKVNIKFLEDWTSEVANVNTGTAVTLSDSELQSKEQEFIEALKDTPVYNLFTTVSGEYDDSIQEYYYSADA